ncbi:FAD-dependent 5-carboxymethylaminomethyl-2-thiouridine(34) oxidoreductase MnmC [Alcaligenaceae bacterium]|nr:FAD-dependent 5-carboxymethylaminomethyl-2-thiouridine(34) oxidoreductase MnmC [Alcaligenaceae bacterium]
MSSNYQPLLPATLEINAYGVPVSSLYGDVYHTESGGLAQAQHVFLRGCGLPQRWQGRDSFTVCETGFGLGTNFIALWQAWRNDPARCGQLHIVSFEAHPFRLDDLATMLARLPQAEQELGAQLLAAWPPLTPGLHRLEFEGGALTLTLAFGAIARMAKQIEAGVDAFFLDGFSPRLNPEMWTASVFGQLARMARQGATLASWCCAVSVRRSLADAGFLVGKKQGFRGKREMMVATLRPGMGRPIPARVNTTTQIAIVGGGIAAAGIAHALAIRGHEVTVLDPQFAHSPAASHGGHVAAAMTPALSRDDDIRSRLSRAGVARALQRWQALDMPGRPERCGTLLPVSAHEEQRWQDALRALQFPANWVRWLDAGQASKQSGMSLEKGGLWFRDGQKVRPDRLLPALFSHRRIYCKTATAARLQTLSDGNWSVLDHEGHEITRASQVVLANAAGVVSMLSGVVAPSSLPKMVAMYRLAGQISYFRNPHLCRSKVVVAGEGYWLPATSEVHVGGSTYCAEATTSIITTQGHQNIIGKLAALLNVKPSWFGFLPGSTDGWAGWRAVIPDRLPVIGPLVAAPGVWLACAYGSRGLTWSALAADIMATSLHHEPVPLERELLQKIAPR